MKNLKILFLAVLIFNCSTENDEDLIINDCECIKESFERTFIVNSTATGFIPYDVLISQEEVECQDEVFMADFDGTTFYNIVCNDI